MDRKNDKGIQPRKFPPNNPGKIKAMNTREIKSEEKESVSKELTNENFLVNIKKYGATTLALTTVIPGFLAFYLWGHSSGASEQKEQQPELISDLQRSLTASEDKNIDLAAEVHLLEEQLAVKEGALEKANSLLEDAAKNGSTEILTDEAIMQATPEEQFIDEEDSATFFESLTVSIININSSGDFDTTTLSLSARNEPPITHENLKVGDKVSYSAEGIAFEVLVRESTGYSTGITVSKN